MNSKNLCFLIDDDTDDQDLFIMALQEVDQGIQCRIASTGIEALDMLQKENTIVPDYIFLDVNMPKMNGIECLAEIKKISHLQKVPVIMFSTSSDKNIIKASKELGARDFHEKPTKFGLLVERLARILQE